MSRLNTSWNCLPTATVFSLYKPTCSLINCRIMKPRHTDRIVDNETLGTKSDLLTLEDETNTLSRNVSKESPPYAELYPRTAQILFHVIFIRRRTFFQRPLMCHYFRLVISCFPPVLLDVNLKHVEYY